MNQEKLGLTLVRDQKDIVRVMTERLPSTSHAKNDDLAVLVTNVSCRGAYGGLPVGKVSLFYGTSIDTPETVVVEDVPLAHPTTAYLVVQRATKGQFNGHLRPILTEALLPYVNWTGTVQELLGEDREYIVRD